MSEITGVDITWQDLSVMCPLTKAEKKRRMKENLPLDDKTIINKVSGTMKAGTFTAILGPSGCGKTTMLNFLSNRHYYLKGLKVLGEVLVNGHPRKSIDFNSITGYVMQDDVIMEAMTVEEVLNFTAKLRLPADVWQDRVEKVIKDLELHNCRKSEVGGVLKKGISGGEKKRTSIAIEMLTDPAILFLDEPTTGLDSYNSENLVDKLNDLAKTGITVVCTIHQPNSFIYAAFDQVLLLAGGSVMFHGDARDAISHFGELGYPCGEYKNPAEHLLGLLSPIDDTYEGRMEVLRKGVIPWDGVIEEKSVKGALQTKESTMVEEVYALGKRIWINLARNKLIFFFKVVANFAFVILSLMVFYQVCDGSSSSSVWNRSGVMFFMLMFTGFSAVNSSGAYADEKAMFIREQSSKAYRPLSYYMSKVLFEMPIDVLIRVFVNILVYLGVGLSLDNAEQIFIFVGISALVELASRGWGNFLVIIIPSVQASSAVSPFVMLVQMLFSGFFIKSSLIPDYLIEFEYLSIFKYSWEAAMINEFNTFDRTKCGDDPMCDPNDFFDLDRPMWVLFMCMAILIVLTHFAAYLSLVKLARKFRL
ncbi:unnamed protein product [Blepharisma stoltei]|uniref:ABC transporter domain-containing protein n=1 Tax=Blepharisma stoltei TaxID=1481888 RepID=A0AAU9IGT5_9CILI|nr:unnamed protein product [Blepharisma stoltei]